MSHPYNQPIDQHQAGDGIDLKTVQARGAERHGVIWMLVASTLAAIIAMTAFWFIAHLIPH
ncbi:MAG TPA: hypothetical protein VGI79_18520 [Caulobacteraceae bacterium]